MKITVQLVRKKETRFVFDLNVQHCLLYRLQHAQNEKQIRNSAQKAPKPAKAKNHPSESLTRSYHGIMVPPSIIPDVQKRMSTFRNPP